VFRNLTQNVVQLVEIMLSWKDWPVGQHLCQDAAHRPNINGLGIALQQIERKGRE
jgi:hypothetical protein